MESRQQRRRAAPPRARGAAPGAGATWPLLAPAGAFSIAFVGLPLAGLVALSLCDWVLTRARTPGFAGLANYARMAGDGAFWSSLGTTLWFTAESTALQLVLGVAIALLLNRPWRGIGAIRALFLAPMMIAPLFAGMIWRLVMSEEFGIFKQGLLALGIEDPPVWLSDPRFALQAVILVSVWQWTAFVVLFMLAGLQTIPPDLYEAASLDGCGPWRRFRHITLPMLRPFLISTGLFRCIDGFKTFDLVYAMTGGGPGESTQTISYFVYQQGLNFFDLGYAATLALTMLVLVVLLSWLLLRGGLLAAGRKATP
jgi:ABC-type sugar transport system permease subunit